jgi:hypothetical protein
MIATSDRRPGSVGSYQAVKGIAPEQGAGGSLIAPFEPHYRAYGLFASSSGCQSRLSNRGDRPTGAASFRDKPDGAREINLSWPQI